MCHALNLISIFLILCSIVSAGNNLRRKKKRQQTGHEKVFRYENDTFIINQFTSIHSRYKCISIDEVIFFDSATNKTNLIFDVPNHLKAGTSVQNFTIIKSPRKIDTNTDWDYIEPRFDAIIGTVACQLCHFRDLSMLGKKKLHRKCHPEVKKGAENCNKGAHCGAKTRLNMRQNMPKNKTHKRRKRNLITYDNALGYDKAEWMTSLHTKGLLQDSKLKDMILPGSHNSAATEMYGNKHCDGPIDLTQHLANKFAKVQGSSIMEQLETHGIRFLDLRIIENRDFYDLKYPLHHTYLIKSHINTLETAFDVIENFLDRHPMETVVVRVKGRSMEGVEACLEHGTNSKFHVSVWKKMILERQRLKVMNVQHLETYVKDLKGVALVEINNEMVEYWPGLNFGLGKDDDRGIFKYGQYYKHKIGNPKNYTIWDFFPNVSDKNIDIFLTSIALWHDGLEDWNTPYSKHLWVMDSLISLRAKYVHAILMDFVDTVPVYELATRLTLYRIYDKRAPSSWDLVATTLNVNAWDEEFEHHCPYRFVMQGMESYHDNHREDRTWKFSCRRVEWLSEETFYSAKGGEWMNGFYHPDAFKDVSKEDNFIHDWDAPLDFYWENGGIAITGIGSKHSNYYEDRVYYFYASPVTALTAYCGWTHILNHWDGPLNIQIHDNEYIAGVYSYHSNQFEDRRWKLYICTIED